MIKRILWSIVFLLALIILVACKPTQKLPDTKPPVIDPPIVDPMPKPEPDPKPDPEPDPPVEEPEPEPSIPVYDVDTLVATNFINKSKEYDISDSEIDLLYLAESVIPYVNVEDYLMLLNGAYLSNEFEFVRRGTILEINLLIIYDTEEYTESLTLDSDLNIVNVTSLDFFSLYLERTETNYSDGLIHLGATVYEGDAVTFELGNYGFDILENNNDIYLPLAIANLLFNQDNYFDTYFNGEVIYGIDTSSLEDSELKSYIKSSYNKYKLNDELASYDYNFLTFIIDYFYGLKNDRNIKSGKTFVNKEDFLTKGNVQMNIFDVTVKLDDLHTSHMTRGYYDNPRNQLSYTSLSEGPIIKKFYTGLRKVQGEAVSHFGLTEDNYIDFTDFEYIDNDKILVIYILGFDVDTPGEVETIIKNAKQSVEQIVIDLSFNTGGNLGAVLRMFALMTNEVIEYHAQNPLNGEKITYRTKGDKPAYDQYTYSLKISSVTFSAANLAASIAKELGMKVIGRKSSGGASSISFFTFPSGTIIIMSSNMVLSDKEYNSIETGIAVDVVLNNLYEEQEIINALN